MELEKLASNSKRTADKYEISEHFVDILMYERFSADSSF